MIILYHTNTIHCYQTILTANNHTCFNLASQFQNRPEQKAGAQQKPE